MSIHVRPVMMSTLAEDDDLSRMNNQHYQDIMDTLCIITATIQG